MTAIIDYGVGNLFSLRSSFAAIGENVTVTSDTSVIRACDRLILPGVGAFGDAAKKLFDSGLAAVIQEEAARGKPLLGICLGMQLLLEKSYEFGVHEGLGLIQGAVKPIADVIPKGYKIPHIGWNALSFGIPKHPIFADVNEGDHVYFVHSFYATDCESAEICGSLFLAGEALVALGAYPYSADRFDPSEQLRQTTCTSH